MFRRSEKFLGITEEDIMDGDDLDTMPIDPNMDYDLEFERNMEQIDVSQRRLENRLGCGE
jgi:hypothetical protein